MELFHSGDPQGGGKKKIKSLQRLHPARILYHISGPAGVAAGGHSSQTGELPTQRQTVATMHRFGRYFEPRPGVKARMWPCPQSLPARQPIEPKAPCSCVLY